MDFRILGPLEVDDDHGRAIELGGRQQRLVLAMLLLHRNEVVSVDRLIDAVWDERAPANAVKNVRIHVSRLRKAFDAELGSEGESTAGRVRTRANGYVLDVAPGELDVDRFQQLVELGRQALAEGELERAGRSLQDALKLWRGAPLADFTYDAFAQSEIARLEEFRLDAVENQIDADLALGHSDGVVAELQALVAEHPLRERLRGQLMLALYRSGRKADALRVYEDTRRTLAEELGLEPSGGLHRLHRAVLTDDPSLAASRRVSPSPEPGPFVRAPLPLLVRPRSALLGVGGALLLAAALAIAVLAVTRDRPTAGLVTIGPNSLARIDPETNRVMAEIPVGARPASIVSARGQLWVANLDDDTVSRVDPEAGRVVNTIPTGTAPTALAEGHDAVWAIGGDGVVLRIDPVFNKVVARIPTVEAGTLLSVAPSVSGVAVTVDAVWSIAGGFLSTPRVFRIDPETRLAKAVIATGQGPTAIAAGLGDLWVADGFENTVSRIDQSGVVNATIPVGHGASAIAVGEGAAWVVDSLDDAVVRIDPETNSPTTTIPVGRYPSAVAVGAGSVWIANRHDGTVSRIDPRTNEVVETIDVGDSPAGLVFAAGSVWVTNQGILRDSGPAPDAAKDVARLSSSGSFETDPALHPDPQINYATCAKLLNYPDAPAPQGTRLVPEVAASLPTRSADGRTYTFSVRSGFAFSPPLRERVTARSFRDAIERSLHPRMGPAAAEFLSDIAGVDAYRSRKAEHISGIRVDGNRLSITLVAPDPSFLARIAMPFSCAVPTNAPVEPKGVQAIPSAGPYYVAEHSPDHRIVLRRNPNYRGARPSHFREIRYTLGVAPSKAVADVLAGRSDYLADRIPVERNATLVARYGPASEAARNARQRYFVNPTLKLAFLVLNTSRPLFSDVRLRKAVNYAIDRRALARVGSWVSGPFPSITTDQYLPPTMPGASRTVLYPPSGDLRMARRLAPDARGTAVLYTCDDYPPLCRRPAQLIKEDLAALGLDVDIREFPTGELLERAGTRGEPFDLIVATRWGADYADPADFLNVLLDQRIGPKGNFNFAYYTDPELARKLARVARLTGEARYRTYAALSVEIARDAAPWVAYAVGDSRDLFSARIGCQTFQPVYGIDLAALCRRS